MIYEWFKIFNLTDFLALGLVSQDITLELKGMGQKQFLITQGNLTSITYEGVMLPLYLNNKNPFQFDDLAAYVAESNDVYLGFLQEDN